MHADEILDIAIEVLRKPGVWIQGAYAADQKGERCSASKPRAACYCAVGLVYGIIAQTNSNPEVEIQVFRRLRRVIQRWDYKGLTRWNDDPYRTQAQVLQAFIEARRNS